MLKLYKVPSSTHALKSPRITILSYFVECVSDDLLNLSRWFLMGVNLVGIIRAVNEPLLSLEVNFYKRAFGWGKVISNLTGISSQTYSIIPSPSSLRSNLNVKSECELVGSLGTHFSLMKQMTFTIEISITLKNIDKFFAKKLLTVLFRCNLTRSPDSFLLSCRY